MLCEVIILFIQIQLSKVNFYKVYAIISFLKKAAFSKRRPKLLFRSPTQISNNYLPTSRVGYRAGSARHPLVIAHCYSELAWLGSAQIVYDSLDSRASS
jgi:hypothetical protein